MATFYSVIQVSEYIKCVSFICDSNLFTRKLDFKQIPQAPAGSGQKNIMTFISDEYYDFFSYIRTLEKVLFHF